MRARSVGSADHVLPLKLIVAEPDRVKAGARKKHIQCDVDRIVALDGERKDVVTRLDGLRAESKQAGKKIAQASAEAGHSEKQALLQRATEAQASAARSARAAPAPHAQSALPPSVASGFQYLSIRTVCYT